MRAAIYARVSKQEEDIQDPMNQIRPLKKYCDAMGYTIVEEYVDRVSGGDSNRPQFKKMLNKVRQRHIDIIVIWALDRFSRESTTNTLSYIKQLDHYKVALKSMQEPWLDTSQHGISQLLLSIFAWVSAQERKRISERTKAGLARVRAKGVRLGRPPKKAPPISFREPSTDIGKV